MRIARLGLIAVLALVLGGCGADDKPGAGGAQIVPANAPAFIAIDSNADSAQWRQIEELIRRFPDGAQLIRFVQASFEEDTKLSWENDAKPALGDEIALVWLDFQDDGQNVVAVTQPKDEQKFRRAVEKGNASDEGTDGDLVVGEVDDYVVLSDAQAKIDRFRSQAEQGEKLADDALYKDALAELPDDAALIAFARGRDILRVLDTFDVPGGSSLFQLQPGDRPEYLAAAFSAEDGGLSLVSSTRTESEPAARTEPYASKLLADVPGDAVAFATFRGGEAFDRQLDQLQKEEGFGAARAQLEALLGLKIEQLTELFENEVALYVRGGTPFPEVTLLLEAPNETRARAAVKSVLDALAKETPAQPCHEPRDQGGVTVDCVDLGQVAIRTASFDGKVVVTTGVRAIEEIRSDGPRLGDDDGFKDALEAAGLPDRNTGYIWLDLEDGLPIVYGLADAAEEDLPAEVRRNLEPLSSMTVWSTTEGRTSTSELFVAIE